MANSMFRDSLQQKYGGERFLTAQFTGLGGLGEMLSNLSSAISNPEPLLQYAANLIGRNTRRNFERGGTSHKNWIDILPESRARRKVDHDAPALTDAGGLMEAASATTEGVPDSAFSLQNNVLTIGVDRIDAHLHQFGMISKHGGTRQDGRPKGWPARPFMGVSGNQLRWIKQKWQKEIVKAASTSSFSIRDDGVLID